MTTEPRGTRRDDVIRLICDNCGARGWGRPSDERQCADCETGVFRAMGPLAGLVDRWFAPPEQRVAEFYPRHLKLIELIWTHGGRGRETYDALQPKGVSYSRFLTTATEVVVKGLAEGWIEARVPTAPSERDEDYGVKFIDPNRWADELASAFDRTRLILPGDEIRLNVEGDPDPV